MGDRAGGRETSAPVTEALVPGAELGAELSATRGGACGSERVEATAVEIVREGGGCGDGRGDREVDGDGGGGAPWKAPLPRRARPAWGPGRAGVARVMDDQDGDVVRALKRAAVATYREAFAGGAFADAVEPHERIADAQAWRTAADGGAQPRLIAGAIEAEDGCGEGVEWGARAPGRCRRAAP